VSIKDVKIDNKRLRKHYHGRNYDRHPISLSIDCPDRKLDRLTSFFRFLTVIPILIVLSLVTSGGYHWGGADGWQWQWGDTNMPLLDF